MTETLSAPTAPPGTAAPAPPTPATTPAQKPLDHTAGGWPVVPLSLASANSAAGVVGSAALIGGPIAAAVAVTGAMVLAATAARTRKNTSRTTSSKAAAGRIPSQPHRSAGRSSAGSSHRAAGAGRASSGGRGGGMKSAAGRAGSGLLARVPGGRKAAQAAALRAAAGNPAPSRAARRTETTAARRQVADARRAAKAATRLPGNGPRPTAPRKPSSSSARGTSATGRGRLAGTATKAAGKVRSGAASLRGKAVAAGRSASDRQAAGQVKAAEQSIRAAARAKRVAALKRPAQKAARRALIRSAARYHARRAGAAILAGAVGVLGLVTSPLGRKLGWAWLIHPGRRLLARLTERARTARETRDAAIRAELEEAEQAAEEQAAAEESEHETTVGDTVQRPDATTAPVAAPTITTTAPGGAVSTSTNGFRFEELAAEMEQAAQSYEPESAMEILAMIEGLPLALGSVANVMKILAERSDTEFPLDKAVAETFRDAFGAVMAASSLADEMGPIFRRVHETDIARHEDPRNGHEAEKGWNV
ncbi:hypothetical protein OG304_16585 [Streptomyces sp. NBC_00160]|uniref:hypothetical protein n=1 Tax=Streptomyces sp. NBC_00160 TaxID=2903628 RepID=UPI002255F7C4|nr:hypothetical protein [Streptomyces sp. NBC_00160]MCX5305067.1 hypothetical protein [Streptomyces sp. NBC_00160]